MGGKTRISHKIAQLDHEISKIDYVNSEASLTKELMSLYANYLVDLDLLDVAKENVGVANLSFSIAQDLYRSGALNSIDFRGVQVSMLNAENRVLLAKTKSNGRLFVAHPNNGRNVVGV